MVVDLFVAVKGCMECARCFVNDLCCDFFPRGSSVENVLLAGACVMCILKSENIFLVTDASYLATVVVS